MFNVRYILLQHPGGGDLLKDEAGKDATRAFNDFGHSPDAKNTMKKFKIGELVEVIFGISNICKIFTRRP